MNIVADHPVLPFAQSEWRVQPRGSLGAALSEARLQRHMTIEQVAAETRVPIRYLHAIEDERFEVIPGNIYAKGFVKAFARSVGLCERWAGEAIAAAIMERAAEKRAFARV
jgi:cytoskeletal protein RodZ